MSHPAHQRLDRHGGVHHPDEGEGGVAGGGGVGQGGVLVAAELQDNVVYLKKIKLSAIILIY